MIKYLVPKGNIITLKKNVPNSLKVDGTKIDRILREINQRIKDLKNPIKRSTLMNIYAQFTE